MPRSRPVSISIPAINAESSLIQTGLSSDGTLEVPDVHNPMQASWFNLSPTPGEVGPAVILGHVDGTSGAGIFFNLKHLKPGDKVFVARHDGSIAQFSVTRTQTVKKTEFPTNEVYGNTQGPEIRLITCGGAFDTSDGAYVDNVIVYATLVH